MAYFIGFLGGLHTYGDGEDNKKRQGECRTFGMGQYCGSTATKLANIRLRHFAGWAMAFGVVRIRGLKRKSPHRPRFMSIRLAVLERFAHVRLSRSLQPRSLRMSFPAPPRSPQ